MAAFAGPAFGNVSGGVPESLASPRTSAGYLIIVPFEMLMRFRPKDLGLPCFHDQSRLQNVGIPCWGLDWGLSYTSLASSNECASYTLKKSVYGFPVVMSLFQTSSHEATPAVSSAHWLLPLFTIPVVSRCL